MTDEIAETPTEAAPPPPLPGKILAKTREEKGLSVADVAYSLRLSVKQIDAIEADDFDKLPGKTFLRGFVRNYARLLQIDPEPLLQGYLSVTPQQKNQVQAISAPPSRVEFSTPRGQRTFSSGPDRRWLKYALAALVTLVFVGGAAYKLLSDGEVRTVVVKPAGDDAVVPLALPLAQPQAQPLALPQAQSDSQNLALPQEATLPLKAELPPVAAQPQGGAETAATLPKGAKVKFFFSGESWVEIKDKSGRTIYKQTGYAGNEQTISGTPPLSLTVGKAANVKVLYNDKPVDLVPYKNSDVARLNLE